MQFQRHELGCKVAFACAFMRQNDQSCFISVLGFKLSCMHPPCMSMMYQTRAPRVFEPCNDSGFLGRAHTEPAVGRGGKRDVNTKQAPHGSASAPG